ncbi:putative pheromone protein [Chaetomium strumarium]|uniref:Pheromone protein n=1 Tax=Chaetomium strumarium TaxID=1170767 RepID=A0AAJ0M6L6_9PEZI|nr:putative pheromone protein [Chaetomium strumarium]
MKFTLPLTLLSVATSVEGAAVQEADKRWCSTPGQACDTVKRAADAFAAALKPAPGIAARDDSSSETANVARRQLNELALAIAASQGNPSAYYSGLHFPYPITGPTTTTATSDEEGGSKKREAEPWCTQFLGQPCWKKRATPITQEQESKKREAEPWCTQFLGQPCWKKRSDGSDEVETEKREAEAEAEPQGWCHQFLGMPCWKRSTESSGLAAREAQSWCQQFLGMPCWKRDAPAEDKRMADPMCSNFVGHSCYKRDGSSAAAEEHKRCTEQGGSCWQAKRAAAAVINTIDAGNAQRVKREADPQWCRQFLGQPCWKRAAEAEASCYTPDGMCTKATRDLHAMYNVARTIIEA